MFFFVPQLQQMVCQLRAVGPAIGNREPAICKTKFYYKHNDILHVPEE